MVAVLALLQGMSLDVCNLELCVQVLSSVIAQQPDYWSETATFSLSLPLSPPPPSLPVSLCVSLSPLSPLYLSHSSLWSMPGACVVGASVFGCVFVSVQLRLWTCYHVYCVLVRQARVFVCVCIPDWPCFDLWCSVVFELKSYVWQRLVLKQRGSSADKAGVPGGSTVTVIGLLESWAVTLYPDWPNYWTECNWTASNQIWRLHQQMERMSVKTWWCQRLSFNKDKGYNLYIWDVLWEWSSYHVVTFQSFVEWRPWDGSTPAQLRPLWEPWFSVIPEFIMW